MEKEKRNNKLMLFVAVFLLVISLIAFIMSLNMDSLTNLQKQEIPISVVISDHTAFNLSKNQSELNLGTVKTGTFGVRNLSISNDYSFKTAFEFEIKGNITPLIVFPSILILEPNEDREITFRTKIIENESLGQYFGILFVKVKKFVE